MSTVLTNIENNKNGYDKRLVVKGASEIVLDTCSTFIDSDGSEAELTEEKKEEIKQIIHQFASKSLRTICFAYKDLSEKEGGIEHDEDDEDMPFNKTVE